jgi:hypothetical protein
MIIPLVPVGGFNPSEKYESQMEYCSQYDEKNKIHVPNHQPDENNKIGYPPVI